MIRIGDWLISPDSCIARKGGQSVKLSPRSMDVLAYLAEHQGEVVRTEDLLDLFWESSSATDHAVHKIMASLRTALGDSASSPRYIKTSPKRGYALIASVDLQAEDTEPETVRDSPWRRLVRTFLVQIQRTPYRALAVFVTPLLIAAITLTFLLQKMTSPAAVMAEDRQILAILPPEGESFNPERQQYQVDGLVSTLIGNISRLPDVDVLSLPLLRESGSSPLDRARELGADSVLTLQVFQAADTLRLNVSLSRLGDGVSLYSDEFELQQQNIFAVHDDIVSSVVASLSIYLDENERRRMENWGTRNALAYDHFLKAEYYTDRFNHHDWELGMAFYRKAIEEDPGFENAYLGYGVAANNMAIYSRNATVEELSGVVLDLHRQLELNVPGSPALETLKDIRLRILGDNALQEESTYRQLILEGDAPDYVYSRYALYLIGARMYDEANRLLAFAANRKPYEVSPNQEWNFRTQVLPPWELVEIKEKQLLDRPMHIGILGTHISSLAIMGRYDKARYYLAHQSKADKEGVRSHLSKVLLAGLSAQSQCCVEEAVTGMELASLGGSGLGSGSGSSSGFPDMPGVAVHSDPELRNLPDFQELFSATKLADEDLFFNNGVLYFLLGDFDKGEAYWRRLSPIDQRKLFTRLHAIEIYFPEQIVSDPRYAALLESLSNGVSWQRQLMEGIMAMESVTGIGLHPESRKAYEAGRLMLENNLWTSEEKRRMQQLRGNGLLN